MAGKIRPTETSKNFVYHMICRHFKRMMSNSKTIVLTVVRHGETDSNKERRLQGQIDTALNEMGLRQAEAAGKALKGVKFHKAYSSDLKRAHKTCQLILDENENASVNSNDVVQDQLIKERSFGEFENTLVDDYAAIAKAKGKSMIDYNPEKGESREDVRNRIRKFLKEEIMSNVKLEEGEPSILMVTHGGVIREFFTVVFDEYGCPLPASAEPGDHKKLAKNTSWSRFNLEINENKIKTIHCHELLNANHLNDLL